MEENEIQKHREKYPISIDEITAYSSFFQILGKNPNDYTPDERKLRWDKNMSELEKLDKDLADFWRFDTEEQCGGCSNRITDGNHWCKWSELPCSYNPVTQMLGMACMGIGRNNQQVLDL